MEQRCFSKNIIFFDSEFSSLDPQRGEILSLALVRMSGESLYLELEFDGEIDEWPKKNVLHYLTRKKTNRARAVELIKDFAGNGKPYVVAYVNQFDMIYLYKLAGLEVCNGIFEWIPIDMASILFQLGYDPESLVNREEGFFKDMNIDASKYNQHNALDDAMLLRDLYLKLFSI